MAVAEREPLAPEVETPARHGVNCMHTNFRARVVSNPETRALSDQLKASLTKEQWRLHLEAESLHIDDLIAAEDQFIDELGRHFPLLAPAIRTVAQHLGEQKLADVGSCCEELDQDPASRAWETDVKAEDDRQREAFEASLSPAQMTFWMRVQMLHARRELEQMERVIAETIRHLPGLAPVLGLLAEHLIAQRTSDVGVCCTTS